MIVIIIIKMLQYMYTIYSNKAELLHLSCNNNNNYYYYSVIYLYHKIKFLKFYKLSKRKMFRLTRVFTTHFFALL